MSLQTILDSSLAYQTKKQGLSVQRINAQIDNIRYLISFFRQYPDIFVDFIKGPESTFKFYFFQRVFLRQAIRHRVFYATYPRAFSKSFLSMMILMIRCILFPNVDLFITTGGKLIVL